MISLEIFTAYVQRRFVIFVFLCLLLHPASFCNVHIFVESINNNFFFLFILRLFFNISIT